MLIGSALLPSKMHSFRHRGKDRNLSDVSPSISHYNTQYQCCKYQIDSDVPQYTFCPVSLQEMVFACPFGHNSGSPVSLMGRCLFARGMTSMAQSCLCPLCYQSSPSSIGSLTTLTAQTNKSLSEAFGAYRILVFFFFF